MKTELFIFSYLPDKPWLEYCLRSVKKFCVGFSGVTLVVPWEHLQHFLQFEGEATADGKRLYCKCYAPYPGRGHLAHQAMKCYADIYAPNADRMAFIDSDSIFVKKFTPEDMLDNGRPVIYARPYAKYDANAPEMTWKDTTERALHIPAVYETMQRIPECFNRSIFKSTRERVESTNFIPFQEYVISQKPTPLWGFSEYNCLGSWALHNHGDEYVLFDMSEKQPPDLGAIQMWSHLLHEKGHEDEYRKTIERFEEILK